jgi:hypothetical protein
VYEVRDLNPFKNLGLVSHSVQHARFLTASSVGLLADHLHILSYTYLVHVERLRLASSVMLGVSYQAVFHSLPDYTEAVHNAYLSILLSMSLFCCTFVII